MNSAFEFVVVMSWSRSKLSFTGGWRPPSRGRNSFWIQNQRHIIYNFEFHHSYQSTSAMKFTSTIAFATTFVVLIFTAKVSAQNETAHEETAPILTLLIIDVHDEQTWGLQAEENQKQNQKQNQNRCLQAESLRVKGDNHTLEVMPCTSSSSDKLGYRDQSSEVEKRSVWATLYRWSPTGS